MRRNPDLWAIGFVLLAAGAIGAATNVSRFVLERVARDGPARIERKAELLGQRIEQKAKLIEERVWQAAQRIEERARRAERLGKIFNQ